ncbi:flippase-like domain-containing protein [Eubacteriales bacterium OttesenSCG-928-G02]|nr:flippase-like domain-containing protein [Eubacteriales bacterium OttesenSCG-928-G02]
MEGNRISRKRRTMNEKKSNSRQIFISVVFLIAMFFVTYFFLLRKFDFKNIMNIIKTAQYGYIAAAFLMVLIYLLCYGITVRMLLRSLGNKTTCFRGFLYAGIDFFYSAITPSAAGGQPFVIYYMTKDNIPTSHASFATLMHTTVFKIVLIVLNIVAVILYGSISGSVRPLAVVFWFVGLAVTLGLIFICFLSMFKADLTMKVGSKIINALCKVRIFKNPEQKKANFRKVLDEYQQAAELVKGKPFLMLKLFITVLIQRTAYFSIAFLVYKSFGLHNYGYFYFLAIQSMIALAVDILPVPGGVGVNEIAIILMYEKTFGIEQSASGMLLIRFINYYFCLALCTVAAGGIHIIHSLKRRIKNERS